MSIHYCGDHETAALIFRTIITVNQLSMYGAVADWFKELVQRIAEEF